MAWRVFWIGAIATVAQVLAVGQDPPNPPPQPASKATAPQRRNDPNLDPWTPWRDPKLPADAPEKGPEKAPAETEKEIWAHAKPYLDESLPQLAKEIPDLKGTQAAANQDGLPGILSSVGNKCLDLLRRAPNVRADESIKTYVPYVILQERRVEYLLLVGRTDSNISLRESRMDGHGKPISNMRSAEGFASMWVYFFPANQSESRFRLLGTQRVGRRDLLVVAFAQIPEKVRFPADFDVEGTRAKIFFQGIAWIDPSSWNILRVREDLLAPRTDLNLTKFTAQVRFGSVTVKKAATALWLPQEADLRWTLKQEEGVEQHRYSNYRLYVTKSKVIYTP